MLPAISRRKSLIPKAEKWDTTGFRERSRHSYTMHSSPTSVDELSFAAQPFTRSRDSSRPSQDWWRRIRTARERSRRYEPA